MDKKIKIDDYNYVLPDSRIAKYPLPERDQSRLLTYINEKIDEDKFVNISKYISTKSLILLNNTKVVPARIFFKKSTGAKIEIFCLEPCFPLNFMQAFSCRGVCDWKCMVGNLKKWGGEYLSFCFLSGKTDFYLKAKLIERLENCVIVRFEWDEIFTFGEVLEKTGNIPIPPYLNRNSEDIDKTSYQTIFGRFEGSVAAPTAGLHFTKKVFDDLEQKSINVDYITLHVGAGTFKPVSTRFAEDHSMHQEIFTVSLLTLQNIIQHIGNITAVGTTTVRTLESLYFIGKQILSKSRICSERFEVKQWEPYIISNDIPTNDSLEAIVSYMHEMLLETIEVSTSIMIFPGYKQRVVNNLITNFHQPKSTLLLLLASFVGENWKLMYEYALRNDFRFLSYGDACLIMR